MHCLGASHTHLAGHCVKQEAGTFDSDPAGLVLRWWDLRSNNSTAWKCPARKTVGQQDPEGFICLSLNINRIIKCRNGITFQGESLASQGGK